MASFSGIKNTLLAEQVDKEAAPAHDPNLKNSKAPERYAPEPCCHFLWKKIMLFRGAAALSHCPPQPLRWLR